MPLFHPSQHTSYILKDLLWDSLIFVNFSILVRLAIAKAWGVDTTFKGRTYEKGTGFIYEFIL